MDDDQGTSSASLGNTAGHHTHNGRDGASGTAAASSAPVVNSAAAATGDDIPRRDSQVRENDSALGDEIQDSPPPGLNTNDNNSSTYLPRQVTFGFVPPVNNSRDGGETGQEDGEATSRQSGQRWPSWLDGSAVCYFFIAGFMIGVGLTITILTLTQKVAKDDDDVKGGSSDVVVWIVGPVFICSGLLVCIKAVSHIYHRMHPSANTNSDGHLLTSDSRPSLNRQNSGMPPCYSQALNAPVPSTVIEEELPAQYLEDEEKFSTDPSATNDEYQESMRLVTLNFEPSPPTYDEALDIIQKSLSAEALPAPGQCSSGAGGSSVMRAYRNGAAGGFDRRQRATTLDQPSVRNWSASVSNGRRGQAVTATATATTDSSIGPTDGLSQQQHPNSFSSMRSANNEWAREPPPGQQDPGTDELSNQLASQNGKGSRILTALKRGVAAATASTAATGRATGGAESDGQNASELSSRTGSWTSARADEPPPSPPDETSPRPEHPVTRQRRISANTRFRSAYNSDPQISSQSQGSRSSGRQ